MKGKTKKILFHCLFLLITLNSGAADIGEGTSTGGTGDTSADQAAAPINFYIIPMLLLGILIGFYMIKKQTQKKALKG